MRWELSLHSAINEFREDAKRLATRDDQAALQDLYRSFIDHAQTAANAGDAAWFLDELRKAFRDAHQAFSMHVLAA